MSRPRVCHLIHHLRIGGAEALLVDLLPRLAAAGFDIDIVCLDDRGPGFDTLTQRGIRSHFVGRRRHGIDLAAVRRLALLLRHLRSDILNTHAFSAGFWGRLAAVLARTPHVVATMHTVAGWSQPVKQRLGNRLLQSVTDRIVAVSHGVRHSLIAQGTPPDLVEVIHNGIDFARFSAPRDPARERLRLGLPVDRLLVGMVGRCSPEKGGEHWLRALSLLAIDGHPVHGVLVGNGPLLGEWKELAGRLRIAHRVTFVGESAEVAQWLGILDVLLCPSLQESFGLAALEAQAAGVPVVATRTTGFQEILHDGDDALLVPPADSLALFAAARRLLVSPDTIHRLVAAGRHNAGRFTIQKTADGYATLYRNLLAIAPGACRTHDLGQPDASPLRAADKPTQESCPCAASLAY